ncbi:hypothetical protein GCM10011613_08290 [Cellvibrio zantedeschiae]|uniref:C-type lectin domain-containing protein n=1 Tax=Cellvibrio zantedeschiae TaxID=1237077 RepID=A0ABQ3AWQ6_9GAMM|nr:lectin-like protein [Cellvibrio zantedeschiae]GGY66653.1 hypothetical protein GCM10011613_08290 [Cellvibrio zantedeschiae]
MKKLNILALTGVLALTASSANAISLVGSAFSFGGHDYTLISSDNWTNSEAFAVTQGGHLVAVNDINENNFIINTFGLQNSLWIGLYRTAPHASTWAWTNGDAVTFANWAGGEPNDAGTGEEYVHTYVSGLWNDLDDNNSYSGPKYGVLETVSTKVPEPSSVLMLLGGLLAMFGIRRQSK